MALTTLSDGFKHLSGRHGLARHLAHQLTDDLAINLFEMVDAA